MIIIALLLLVSYLSTELTHTKLLSRSGSFIDIAWNQYVHSVYGSGDERNDVSKSRINFIYKHAPVKVIPLDWPNAFDLFLGTKGIATAPLRRSFRTDEIYDNQSWVEVTREAHHEGLLRSNVPYGCWFHKFNGTGVFVNIGHTLVPSKANETLLLENYLHSKPAYRCTKDQCTCPHALASGYDSVQLDGKNELVLCNGACGVQPVNHTCPGLQLRKDRFGSRACNCSDKSVLLNCGGVDMSRPHRAESLRPISCIARSNFSREEPAAINVTIFMNINEHSRSSPVQYATVKSMSTGEQLRHALLMGYRASSSRGSKKLSLYMRVLRGWHNSFYNIMDFRQLDVTNTVLQETFTPFSFYEDSPDYSIDPIDSMVIRSAEVAFGVIRFSYRLNESTLLVGLIKEEALCLFSFGCDVIMIIEEPDEWQHWPFAEVAAARQHVFHRINSYVDFIVVIDHCHNLSATDLTNLAQEHDTPIASMSLEQNSTRRIDVSVFDNKLTVNSMILDQL